MVRDEFNGAAHGPSSRYQIKENNKNRPKPVVIYEYTPNGPIRQEVMTAAAAKKNAEIDHANALMERRLARRKGRAKSKFNQRSKNSWGLE